MTVAEITVQNVADYLRLSEVNAADAAFISTALGIAKQFINDYTRQPEYFVNTSEPLVIVVYVLCQDMYDTRALCRQNQYEQTGGNHSRNVFYQFAVRWRQ